MIFICFLFVFIELDKMISIPMFYGQSFLHFTDEEIMKRIRGSKLDLKLRFRAFSSEGLLFWAGSRQNLDFNNYMGVGLKNGLIKCSFNLGSGRKEIIVNTTRVDDGNWHNLHIIRYKRQVIVKIDKHSSMAGRSPEPRTQLNINSGLYLGILFYC